VRGDEYLNANALPPILLAAMALDLGGAETHVISLAQELKRRGCHVLVASAGGRMVGMLEEAGIAHHVIPMGSRNPVVLLRAYRLLSALIRRERVGLVHAHARIPAWLSSLALRGSGRPLVTTYHGVYKAGFPWNYLTAFGSRTIAVSEDVRHHLVNNLGAPGDQIRVIPNGFDIQQFRRGVPFDELAQEFGELGPGPHVVHASRLTDSFADVAATLVAAVPDLVQTYPNLRLWVLGEGNRRPEIAAAAAVVNQHLGRPAAVIAGARLDVPRFFNLADCVVAVARTALEAMACEQPVIIAGEGGYRGPLYPEDMPIEAAVNFTARGRGRALDPVEMANAIRQLLAPESADLRRRMGEAGRRYVVENFSIQAVVDQVMRVYMEVL
jgi:glycosyltransferase involved in cell wall biosynthesis